MELHQLRYFSAVAQTGNFTKAATQCHVSQPSLSQQILKLEDEMGSPLFERRRDGVVLTLAGEMLLPHARRVLTEVSDAGARLRDASKLARGRLRLGVIPTIAPFFLPRPLAQFRQNHPGVAVTLREGVTKELTTLLEAEEIDLFIASQLSEKHGGLKPTVLFRESLALTLPSTHPLAHARQIGLGDLQRERFIVLRDEHCLSTTVNGFCQQNELAPNITCHGSQIQTVLAMVASGMGVSLIPAMASQHGLPPGLVLRSLGKQAPTRAIIVYQRKSSKTSPAAASLLALLQAEAVASADK